MRYLISFIIDLLTTYLDGVSTRDPMKDVHGNEILQPPLWYGVLGIISFIIGLSDLFYGLLNYDSDDIYVQIYFFIFFGGTGLFLILHRWVMKIVLTDKYIISITMFGQREGIAWKQITDACYNERTGVLKIQSNETTIKCHTHMVGFPTLIERLEKKHGISDD